VTSNDSLDVLISRPAMLRVDHVYSTKVPKEMKATSQVRCGVVPVSFSHGPDEQGRRRAARSLLVSTEIERAVLAVCSPQLAPSRDAGT
jgi:hypothetical protein